MRIPEKLLRRGLLSACCLQQGGKLGGEVVDRAKGLLERIARRADLQEDGMRR